MATGKGSIKARVIRVTRLDASGVPVTGTCSVIVTDGFIRLQASAEYEDGEEFIVKNAWGDLCINEKDADRLKRMNLTIDFCAVHPDLADMIAGATPILDGDDNVIGFAVTEDVSTSKFMLELWSGVAGDAGSWHYWLFPQVDSGRIGDLTFEYGPLTFTIDAPSRPTDDFDYPYDPAPWTGAPPDGVHYIYVQTPAEPPVPTDGCVAFPLTGVAAIEGVEVEGTANGYWAPYGATAPADLAAANAATTAGTLTASPTSAWSTDSSIAFGTGVGHWNGTTWVTGAAP